VPGKPRARVARPENPSSEIKDIQDHVERAAARYGKVFVTSDKLSALYAWCRGVRFVYLRRQEKLSGLARQPLFHRYTWRNFIQL
jgi:predicted PilT family ATPase